MAHKNHAGSHLAARFHLTATAAASLLAVLATAQQAWAQQADAALPAVQVTGSQYDADDVRPEGVTTATRTYMAPRDIPQTLDTLEVSKYKSYGINDLAVMLDGVPGVNTRYDMRGEGVMIRGFNADSGDIYRDGVRESGQVRRSTANVERIEILKGPASVLYGRSSGGGIVNLVSKQARFDAKSSATLRGGSWDNYGGTLDINKVINEHVAVRLTADREQADSFRSGIRNRNEMLSPSILVDTRTGLRWSGQYTYDNIWRVPDRGPVYDQLPAGVSIRKGFAHPDDYVEDRLRVLRSDLSYDFNSAWSGPQRKIHHRRHPARGAGGRGSFRREARSAHRSAHHHLCLRPAAADRMGRQARAGRCEPAQPAQRGRPGPVRAGPDQFDATVEAAGGSAL